MVNGYQAAKVSFGAQASHHDLEIFGAKMSTFGGMGDDDPFMFNPVSPSP